MPQTTAGAMHNVKPASVEKANRWREGEGVCMRGRRDLIMDKGLYNHLQATSLFKCLYKVE